MTTKHTNNNKISAFRQELVDKMLEMIDSGTLFWNSPNYKPQPAHNGISKRPYQKNNQFMLSMIAYIKGYDDPRWYTQYQIKEKGYRIQKGERHTKVEYWSLYDKENKKTVTMDWYNSLSPEEREDIKDNIVILNKFSRVFNAKQLTGVPEYKITDEGLEDKNIEESIERMSRGMGVDIFETSTATPFYSPSKDHIEIPETKYFKSDYDLNATVLHELAHATGHSSRLNRLDDSQFGSEGYAIEELRAEMSSFFLAFEYNMPQGGEHIENHGAYIQSWSKAIQDDSNVLFRAIKDASDISDYLVTQDQKQLAKDLYSKGNEMLVNELNLGDDFEMEL